METLISAYENLSTLMQIFWGCAIVSSIFMLIQLCLSLFGMGDFELDADVNSPDALDASGGMDLFTIKNITNFFVGFGWAGVSFRNSIDSDTWLLILSIGCGLIFVAIFIFIFKQLMKLESNSVVGVEACLGKTANVYLRIPENRTGKGKIQISINGTPREYPAVTDESTAIPTGASVKIIDINGSNVVVTTL
ncbi:MAG: hypothetical protein J6R79_02745 [Bacteroidaceae bacterium]|nr:hypothetical protein [Bacteroidaceae bacterium]